MRIPSLRNAVFPAFLFAATFGVAAQPAAEKLARPTPQQAAWHDCEVGMFIHFGPATWQDSEYDTLGTPLQRINPDKLDTDQWVSAAEAMGAKYIVFVAKHTGGFCWWQTDTTDYGVRNIPWRGGRGDVMKDLAESCRKRGIKLGVYLSPADAKFGAGGGGRCKTPEAQERYDKIYRQQLTELLSRYGEMFEVWFDGSSITDVGDLLKQHCPKAMVFQGPYATIRWVGNEDGVAPYPNWNSLPLARAKSGVSTGTDGHPDGDAWMPNECDARIRATWFWNSHGAGTLKSLDQLMSMYYQSVGRGSVLLLNMTPDTTGAMPAADVKRAAEFGAEIRRRFGKSIAETSGQGELVELDLGRPNRIDHVITMENIVEGERVREYVIEGLVSGQWKELSRGSSIGHKKIDQFAPTEVSKVRLRVVKSAAAPQIRKLAVYRVAGVEVRLLKDYDPGGGKVAFYNDPPTDWKRLRVEDFQLDGVRVRIIIPEKPLPGNHWLLERGAGEPLQVARALLEKGIYYVGMDADDFGSSQAVARWNALYAELTEKRGFSKKAVLEGYSRSGLGVYNWAAENPEKVACIYVDAPVLNIQSWPGGKGKGPGWPEGWKELQRLYGFKSEAEALAYDKNPTDQAPILARANVPIIHVCGDSDLVVPYEENTGLFKDRYEKAGGRNMTILLKGGTGHWTHGLKNPTPVVEFILRAITGGGEAAALEADSRLLFASFRDNGEDGLHLRWSRDGMKWEAIQNDKSFLRPTIGAKIMRDPSLIQGPDGVFHLVWTSGWWEKTIGYASSKDLVRWPEQVALPVMTTYEPQAHCCWAPEIRYDEHRKEYLIYWSSHLEGETATRGGQFGPRYFRTYATTTTDFKTFTPTRLFFDPPTVKGASGEGGQIDSSSIKIGDKYYLFYKQGYNPGGIRYAVADTLAGNFQKVFPMFAQDNDKVIWEGPTAAKIGDYCVVYTDRGMSPDRPDRMGAWRSKDMIHWEDISLQMRFPPKTQHGSVLRVPRSVVDQLTAEDAP